MANFNKYNDIFIEHNIGELGLNFFKATGHLYCDAIIDFDVDVIDLLRRKTNSRLFANESLPPALKYVKQVAYIGEVKNEFNYSSRNESIAYFAIQIEIENDYIKETVFEIQKVLMRGNVSHIVILYKINDIFVVSYAFRVVGDNSRVVYSDWIFDDESAEIVMDKISAWYFSSEDIRRFTYDLRVSLRKESSVSGLSHQYIAYEIFPLYYEQFGFNEESLPKMVDRKSFVSWFRKQSEEHFPDLEYNSFYLRKDDISEHDDDDDFDIDELEQQMLLEMMTLEEVDENIINDDMGIDTEIENEINNAIRIGFDNLDSFIDLLASDNTKENAITRPVKSRKIDNTENLIKKEIKKNNNDYPSSIKTRISHNANNVKIKLISTRLLSHNSFKCVFNIANKINDSLSVYMTDVIRNDCEKYSNLIYVGEIKANKVGNISCIIDTSEVFRINLSEHEKLSFVLTVYNPFFEEVLTTDEFCCYLK